MGGISIWQLLIVVVIIALLFGTKKLRTIGSDLGAAVKGFKKAINNDDAEQNDSAKNQQADADFEPKNISSQTTSSDEEQKKPQDKEQV